MLTLLSKLTERVPARQKQVLRVGWPFLLFAVAVTSLTLLDGRPLNFTYFGVYSSLTGGPESAAQMNRIDPSGHSFISRLGAFGLALMLHPLVALCLLTLVWSMSLIHYRYFFRDALAKATWGGWFGYAAALLVVSESLTTLGAEWLGKDNRLARDFTMWTVIFWIGHGTWNHFREVRRTQRALTEQATQAELAALKAQINPHFLFNSLNNIFGTALTEGGQRTPDGV